MTTTTTAPLFGIHDGISNEDYHTGPMSKRSLSVSGAKRILECPAKYRHEQDNPPDRKKAFDFGTAAHALVLEQGAGIAVIPSDLLSSNGAVSTKEAKEFAALARLDGLTPIKESEKAVIDDMAAKIRAHPVASALFKPGSGKAEQSLYWEDERTGITRRARVDWLPDTDGGRLIVPDYKTAASSEPHEFARAAANFGYAQQDAWYTDGIRAVGYATDPVFLFVVQEKTAPYVVTVIQLDVVAQRIGHDRNQRAIDRYIEHTTTGHWPGYTDEVALVPLPRWAETQHEEDYSK